MRRCNRLPPQDEESFRKQVEKLAWLAGFDEVYHTKRSEGSPPGWPDEVMIRSRDRRIIYAELKREGEEPTPDQWRVMYALASIPQNEVYWWVPSDMPSIIEILNRGAKAQIELCR